VSTDNRAITEQSVSSPVAHACRWRTSAETLDLIEALERIEALLSRLDERIAALAQRDEQPGSTRGPT
jgi:hypothetical protein